jgi:hypothetical protein
MVCGTAGILTNPAIPCKIKKDFYEVILWKQAVAEKRQMGRSSNIAFEIMHRAVCKTLFPAEFRFMIF